MRRRRHGEHHRHPGPGRDVNSAPVNTAPVKPFAGGLPDSSAHEPYAWRLKPNPSGPDADPSSAHAEHSNAWADGNARPDGNAWADGNTRPDGPPRPDAASDNDAGCRHPNPSRANPLTR